MPKLWLAITEIKTLAEAAAAVEAVTDGDGAAAAEEVEVEEAVAVAAEEEGGDGAEEEEEEGEVGLNGAVQEEGEEEALTMSILRGREYSAKTIISLESSHSAWEEGDAEAWDWIALCIVVDLASTTVNSCAKLIVDVPEYQFDPF